MVKPAQHWVRDDFSFSFSARRGRADRSALGDALVRAPQVEKGDVLTSKPGQMMVVEDEDVVEHLAPEGTGESLGDGVHVGRPDRRLDDANGGPFRSTVESLTELVVTIPDQEPRRVAVHGDVADLLGDPVWCQNTIGANGHDLQPLHVWRGGRGGHSDRDSGTVW